MLLLLLAKLLRRPLLLPKLLRTALGLTKLLRGCLLLRSALLLESLRLLEGLLLLETLLRRKTLRTLDAVLLRLHGALAIAVRRRAVSHTCATDRLVPARDRHLGVLRFSGTLTRDLALIGRRHGPELTRGSLLVDLALRTRRAQGTGTILEALVSRRTLLALLLEALLNLMSLTGMSLALGSRLTAWCLVTQDKHALR